MLGAAPATAASSSDGAEPRRTAYTVVSRSDGLVSVAALEWLPAGAKTVLLAVHGSGGVKENNWGPLTVPGYSFAQWRVSEGRAVVAIDLPGYGGSPADENSVGVEDYAFVVAQIAQDLRERFPKIVGAGHSMGALVVDVAQGLFRSFDAIIPAAWSHGGYSAEYKATCGNFQCPNIRDMLFVRHQANPKVVEDFIAPLEGFSDNLALNIALWGGFFTRPTLGPSPDDVTAFVDVPVMIILGAKDFFWDRALLAAEPSHFPLSPSVRLLLLPNTGHAVFHHVNYDQVETAVGDWLTEQHL